MSGSPNTLGVRDASPADNDALVDLAQRCPMDGDIGLCVNRRPDFFALNRLEGKNWRVGVVDGPDGTVTGSIAVAERLVYIDAKPQRTMYVSDLKVDPAHRGKGAADALVAWARDHCSAHGDVLTFLTILAGNRSMQRRLSGPRGLPSVHHFATVRSSSISLLWRRRVPRLDRMRVARGTPDDLDDMGALWQQVAPGRQFAPVHNAASLTAWVDAAPGLEISSYWLARSLDGQLLGFVGLWDQESFKQMRVTSYSRRLAVVRRLFNAASPLVGAARLPPPGGSLRYLTAVHVCVPPTRPDLLRSLLLHAYNELRGRGYSFITIGLDVQDPLRSAVSGLLEQPTDVWACIANADGPYDGPALDSRPVHAEIALV